jgi:hypothetical protein
MGKIRGGCSGRRKRRPPQADTVHNHRRLRAREDGEKPSPPRDCKAEELSARATVPLIDSTRIR